MKLTNLISLATAALLSWSAAGFAAEQCTAIGASYYYQVTHADLRKCMSPMCGGYFVKQVNQAKTLCADGVWRNECHVFQLDAKALHWTAQQTGDYFTAVFGENKGIVRGNFAHALDAGIADPVSSPDTLTIVEAWQAQGKAVSPEPVYHVKNTGIVCIAYPCDDTVVQLLNAWERKDRIITDIKLDKVGATQQQLDAANKAFSEDGILVAGKLRLASDKKAKLIVASQFYLPAVAATAGQVCNSSAGSCATGQVCNIATANSCGNAALQGTCQVKPELCTLQYDPVCGCDGVTYGNDCQRLAAGAQLDHAGECKK